MVINVTNVSWLTLCSSYFGVVQVYVGVPVQVAEEQLHGVLVGFGQFLDQFLHSLNFVFGFFDLCSEKQQQQ